MHDLFRDLTHLSLAPINLAIRAVVVYLTVLILLRISGKRQFAQMGATEFVALLLISNAVQNSMNGGDNSLAGGLFLAAILILTSWLISLLTFHSRKFSLIFEGTPTLLIHNGKPIQKHLNKERLTLEELKTLLRKNGVHHFGEVKVAILEADGSFTFTKNT